MKTKAIVLTGLLALITAETNSRSISRVYPDVFSEDKLISYMEELGIRHIDIVLAQAKIESSHFRSTIFKENNNLFGMKLAKKRKTTAIGKSRSHAKYRNWRDSVMDYKLWQDRYAGDKISKKQYLDYLERVYAEDKNYVSLISKM